MIVSALPRLPQVLLELLEKTRECAGTDRYVLADFDVAFTKRAGNNLHPFAIVRVFDP